MSCGRETRKAKAQKNKAAPPAAPSAAGETPSNRPMRPRAPKQTHHEFQNVVNPKASRASHLTNPPSRAG